MPAPYGYKTPGTPNEDERHIAYPDGSFAFKIWEQDETADEPFIRTALSQQARIMLSLDSTQGKVFKVDGGNGISEYHYVIAGPLVQLPVGTLEFHAVINGKDQFKKWVTIPDTPFATGGNSEYLEATALDNGAWVLKGETILTGGETGIEIRYYKPMLQTPNYVSVGLYDGSTSLSAHKLTVSEKNGERFQVTFDPVIPADVNYTLVWAAWV